MRVGRHLPEGLTSMVPVASSGVVRAHPCKLLRTRPCTNVTLSARPCARACVRAGTEPGRRAGGGPAAQQRQDGQRGCARKHGCRAPARSCRGTAGAAARQGARQPGDAAQRQGRGVRLQLNGWCCARAAAGRAVRGDASTAKEANTYAPAKQVMRCNRVRGGSAGTELRMLCPVMCVSGGRRPHVLREEGEVCSCVMWAQLWGVHVTL